MYNKGITFTNTAQVIGSGLGLTGGLGTTCFTAGTQVVVGAEYTEDDVFVQYVTMNIEDIQVGDLVYSYDTETGAVSLKPVTDVIVRESDHINYLTISNENGNEQIIETTDGHPFWVVTDDPDLSRAARSIVDENGAVLYHENIDPTQNGYWVEAKDLREGDAFLGANGELSTLQNKERVEYPEGITVYNFTVDGNHDYYVIAEGENGETCILVHNAGGWYICDGVRRSIATRESGLTHILADATEQGKTTQKLLPIDKLHSPKTELPIDDRYKRVLEGMASPEGRAGMPKIQVEPLGASGQTGSIPLTNVPLVIKPSF